MTEPRVFLVGAGPGNPGLLTLRAVECLAQADLVLHDRLVPPRLLDYAPAAAERICVEELPGCHPERWPHIYRTMIEAAQQGKCVVRLKSGDPFIFGRGGEEAEALRQAGIAYEIVPGVTSGVAAPAFAGIPLTHRRLASAVAFVTGHEQPGKADSMLDWPALARFPGTLVFYMGMSRLAQIAQALIEHGKPPDTPAAAVRWGSTPEQRTVAAPLAQLADAVRTAGLGAPAIVVIGAVAALRSELAWFETRPLLGKRVVVTRPRHQAAEMCRRLELLGALPIVLPLLDVKEPPDWGPVDRALARLGEYQWVVFTSANGVHAFVRRLRQNGRDLRALGGVRLAVIGPGTADALRQYHLEPDLVPPDYRSESLAAELKERAVGQHLLLARADRGRDVLPRELQAVAKVEQVAVYSQVDLAADHPEAEALRRGEIEFVTVTSSNIARNLARLLGDAGREQVAAGKVRLVSISPVTSEALREVGLSVAAEAREHTTAGVIEVLRELVEQRG